MAVDVRTLLVCNGLVAFLAGTCLLVYKLNQKTYPGFGFWMMGSFLSALGYAALVLRGIIPVWLSILASNSGFVLAGVLRLDGAFRFMAGGKLKKIFYAMPLLVMTAAAIFYFALDAIKVRTLIVSLAILGLTWMIALNFFGYHPKGKRGLYYMFGFFIAGLGLVVFLRSFLIQFIADFRIFDSGTAQVANFLFSIAYEILSGLVFLMLNGQRMEQELLETQDFLHASVAELEKTIAQVKTLSGLLPICASCKRIRDDRGYWNQIEEYIRFHSKAEFSHAICPDCAKKLYPEYHGKLDVQTEGGYRDE